MLSSRLKRRFIGWIALSALSALACSSDTDSAGSPSPAKPPPREKVCALPDGAVTVATADALEAVCGCTQIEGDLAIDASAVRDLDCLTSLREVSGALTLSAAAGGESLDTLAGLSRLERVKSIRLSGLAVRDLRGLTRLMAAESVVLERLGALESLEGLAGRFDRFQLTGCDRLTDLRGLRADVRDFWLEKNAQLRSLEGFAGLPAFPDAASGPTVRLESLPSLERLDGLFRTEAPQLARLQLIGLPKVAEVDVRSARELGALVVRSCAELREIRGLEAIESIGQLHITGLPRLPRLPEFTRLRSAVDLELIELPLVRDLAPLSSLETVERIAFTMMDGLVSLHGLENLMASDRILLEDLLALESLEGLRGLERVNTFWIGGDDALESLRGLRLRQAFELVVRYNDALTTLEGLELLNDVGTLDVSENPKLVSVRALSGLQQAGKVYARANSSLPSCELDWLSMQLPEGTTREFADNGPVAACPP